MTQNTAMMIPNSEVKNIPIISNIKDKKDFFNATQNTNPVADLTKEKSFSIMGIIPEMVQVPDTSDKDNSGRPFRGEEQAESEVLVDRLRVVIVTDKGSYHSFSVTFNNSLRKLIALYEEEIFSLKFNLSINSVGMKQYYNLTIL